jgi:uncharacterized membrane protein YvlD (DUF360 family)
MRAVGKLFRFIFRVLALWAVDTVALLATAALLPGIDIQSQSNVPILTIAAAAALVLDIANLLIRPLFLLMAVPFGFVPVFLIGLVANAVMLELTSALLPSLSVESWVAAFFGGIILAFINIIATTILNINDDDSFYQGVVERLARRDKFKYSTGDGRGLVMLEIDGLSYWHLQKALADGYLPTLSDMMETEGYVASRIDCGLPSQTSGCQSGIMFGDNYDIPAFRWYDKDLGRLIVSSRDASVINQRYARGHGLMRDGSSINNMMNGDALKSQLTLANLRSGSPGEQQRRAGDIYLLMLNPYFFMRTLVLYLADALLELWQGWRQELRKVEPRMNRRNSFFPLMRAATCVFMRDIPTYLGVLDIIRGTPALYITYPGYDEVAHHAGPWTKDAFRTLRQFDRVVARVRETIERKAPRPYELIILSDHGQSAGWTFKQRYGIDLKQFIQQHLPTGISVSHSMGGDDGAIAITALSGELDNVQQQGVAGNMGKVVIGQAQDMLQRGMEQRESDLPAKPTSVTVCGSGNIAMVYFDLYQRKTSLNELQTAYPGMVEALVQHEGVGFVVAYDDACVPIVLGKNGQRNLHTGVVTGSDPLSLFVDPRTSTVGLRAAQVRRVADFPHAGDLIVNSTVYPDGSVAAMEELIGNHGGLGGEQTDAFIFHAPDLKVPPTQNSADLFAVLNARRGLPGAPPLPATTVNVDAWAWSTLAHGLINRPSRWLGRAARVLTLDRNVYREVARDPYMSGPALLIALVMTMLSAAALADSPNMAEMLGRFGLWLASTAIVYLAARELRGQGNFTRTLNAVGFAQVVLVVSLLAFIPGFAPTARALTTISVFAATWMSAAEANELSGWRGLVLPLLAIAVTVVGAAIVEYLFTGALLTMQTVYQQLGVMR